MPNNWQHIRKCSLLHSIISFAMISTRSDKSLSQLTKDLDDVFRKFIQKRDEGKPCFICGNPIPKGEAEVCHFIPRANLNTRWNEFNAHLGDISCNKFDKDHQQRYTLAILRAYGADKLGNLQWLGHSLMKPLRSDLIELIDTYKQKL